MATPIIVNPTKPSQVVVNGTQKSGTPITINTDLDYTRVQSMIGEALGDVKIDTTELAKEQTLLEVSDKLDNLNVDVDLSNVAKQGDDPNATLTAIYKLLKGSEPDTPEVIPEGVAERLALILEFFGIKPIQAYEFMTAEEVCSDLEEIMMSMDIDLTPEKAKEITQQTLNN
jgi:hypothetical protein